MYSLMLKKMTVRGSKIQDKETHTRMTMYAFSAPERYKEKIDKKFEQYLDQFYSVEEDERVIARARFIPFEQNLRGVLKKMRGIASVASAPEKKRGGHIRKLVHCMLKEMNEENIPFSALYPFKDEFYAKFGYVSSQPNSRIQIKADTMWTWDVSYDYHVIHLPLKEGLHYTKEIHSNATSNFHGTVQRSDEDWNEHLMFDERVSICTQG